ncbi:RNA polymerase sigma factor [Thermoactinospora rubra]|uniref:RNA polymerase sigma factor n=1 Tax=Thermoactinospora rubra TaxID=1088767 RepID=UPI001301D979|nr:sigma-70 family RNA polymerase sigma factor [Thermoactinospora rubra]
MPGWPDVDRADDHRILDALRRGDGQAPARLYDAYAERLHDYACALLGDRDAAAEAVHDALVTAHGCAARLKEPARLRAWLYALARFQCVARAKTATGQGTPPPVLDDPEDHELAELVREVVAGELSKQEREVLELSVRHGLTPSEAGSVLGLTSRQAASRLARARDHLENAAAAVVLARTGRAHCPDLSAMVDSWEGPLTPMLRRRLSGHIGGCEVCTEGKQRQVSAARLLDMAPVAFPPISLRRRVIETCGSPELDHTRTLIMDRAESFDRTGFPVAAEHRRSRRRPRRLAPVVVLAAGVLAATGAAAWLGGGDEPGTPTAMRLLPTGGPSHAVALPEPDPQTQDPEARNDPEDDAEPEEDAAATPTPTPPAARPTVTRPPARRPATQPTRRRPVPAAPRLSVGCPAGFDGVGSVRLSAAGAAVRWHATVSEGLLLLPSSGTLRAGGSASLSLVAEDPAAPGSGTVAFSSNGGAATCTVSWDGEKPHTSDPPTDGPTPSVGPSESPQASETAETEHS